MGEQLGSCLGFTVEILKIQSEMQEPTALFLMIKKGKWKIIWKLGQENNSGVREVLQKTKWFALHPTNPVRILHCI